MKNSKQIRGNILLLITAFIWGTTFVAQKSGVGVLRPNTFNGVRTLLGCIVLLPVICFKDFSEKKRGTFKKSDKKTLISGGLICGTLLCIASTAQNYGLLYADAGKAGFVTALYIIFVPIFGIFLGRRIRPLIAAGALIATAGLYFLCVSASKGFSLNRGDLLLLFCAVVFALHILAIDRFSPKVDGVKLSCMQFFTAGIINLVFMFILDKPAFSDIISCWGPLLYSGAMSCGVAYTLQIVAQKHAEPAVASILMSMESLFALLAGIVVLGEQPTPRELIGCALMMTAIILVQLPAKTAERAVSNNE